MNNKIKNTDKQRLFTLALIPAWLILCISLLWVVPSKHTKWWDGIAYGGSAFLIARLIMID